MDSDAPLRRTFTLRDLFVLIAVIGLALALLPPFFQGSCRDYSRNLCRNNLRNLGLAIVQYESARGHYPGY